MSALIVLGCCDRAPFSFRRRPTIILEAGPAAPRARIRVLAQLVVPLVVVVVTYLGNFAYGVRRFFVRSEILVSIQSRWEG